jgi:DNA gyrase subunit A
VLAVCERGYGKRTALEEFRQQKRGGKGIILIDTSERNGPVVGLALVGDEDEVMLVTDRGQTIRTRVAEIRETGRNAQGVRVMNVDSDERVVAIERLGERDEDEAASVTNGQAVLKDLSDETSEDAASDDPMDEAVALEDASGDDDAAGDDEASGDDDAAGDDESGDEATGTGDEPEDEET